MAGSGGAGRLVIAEPDVRIVQRRASDQMLVVACDGICEPF